MTVVRVLSERDEDEVKAKRLEFFFFSSRRRHTRLQGDWSSDVCSSDLPGVTPNVLSVGILAKEIMVS